MDNGLNPPLTILSQYSLLGISQLSILGISQPSLLGISQLPLLGISQPSLLGISHHCLLGISQPFLQGLIPFPQWIKVSLFLSKSKSAFSSVKQGQPFPQWIKVSLFFIESKKPSLLPCFYFLSLLGAAFAGLPWARSPCLLWFPPDHCYHHWGMATDFWGKYWGSGQRWRQYA